MDRFQRLIEEFVPADMLTFDRDMTIKLMELAFRDGENWGSSKMVESLRSHSQPMQPQKSP